jgi:glutaredoxin
MKSLITLLILTASALVMSNATAQNMFRWVDKDGKVHFSDQPPPPSEKNVTQKRVQGNVIEVDKLPFATRDAMRRNPVVLYTASNCAENCKDARDLLTTRGIPFTEKVADKDEKLLAELKKLSNDSAVPLLLIGQNQIKGFDVAPWQSALDSAGYPRVNANVGEIKPIVIDKVDDPKAAAKADTKADTKADPSKTKAATK